MTALRAGSAVRLQVWNCHWLRKRRQRTGVGDAVSVREAEQCRKPDSTYPNRRCISLTHHAIFWSLDQSSPYSHIASYKSHQSIQVLIQRSQPLPQHHPIHAHTCRTLLLNKPLPHLNCKISNLTSPPPPPTEVLALSLYPFIH